jgi:CheY-like chemotaxis protein
VKRHIRQRLERTALRSILLVDDDQDSLTLYSTMLKARTTAHIVSTRYPSEAFKLATRSLFDVVIIDVTISYRGTPFGGLELYDLLFARYGQQSLIVYSGYITDDLLRQYDYAVNFIDRGADAEQFIDQLLETTRLLRQRQTCFIAMPFESEQAPIFDAIRGAVESCGYQCVRVDQGHFTESIVTRIHSEIRGAKIIVFVATGRNPNAFYECGYAVSLGKEVVMVTDDYSHLPFDIRDRNAIAYSTSADQLSIALRRRLRGLTGGARP